MELLELWPFWKIWIDLEDVPSESKWPEQIHSIKVSAVGGRIIIFYVQIKRYSSVSNVESASFIKIKSRRGRCGGQTFLVLMGRKTDGPPSYGSRDEPYKPSRYAGMLFLQEKEDGIYITLVLNKMGLSDILILY